MLGPSLGELSGSGCVSKNRPSTPIAVAARASGSTIARLPPVASPSPPGSCTLCVASKTTGTPSACICGIAAHVVHQPAIAEERAALAQQILRQPALAKFADHVLHVARGHELPLLHVHGPAGLRGGHQQIGLASEKRGNLQQVANFRHRRGLLGRECRSSPEAGLRL